MAKQTLWWPRYCRESSEAFAACWHTVRFNHPQPQVRVQCIESRRSRLRSPWDDVLGMVEMPSVNLIASFDDLKSSIDAPGQTHVSFCCFFLAGAPFFKKTWFCFDVFSSHFFHPFKAFLLPSRPCKRKREHFLCWPTQNRASLPLHQALGCLLFEPSKAQKRLQEQSRVHPYVPWEAPIWLFLCFC